MTHRHIKIVGLCNPRAESIRIECRCGHVAEGRTFAAARAADERHATAPSLREQLVASLGGEHMADLEHGGAG